MTHVEYELRVLEVNPEELIKKIEALGGKRVEEYFFRRYVFNTIPAKEGKWIRLRTNGKHTTLTVKQINADTVDGTLEWETAVADFDMMFSILSESGLAPKGYQENRRIEYRLGDATLAVDTWPKIPPYLEIEAADEEAVRRAATQLGYTDTDLVGINNQKIYLQYGIDIEAEPDLSFETIA